MKKILFLLFTILFVPVFATAQIEGLLQSQLGSAVNSDADIEQLLKAVRSNNLHQVKNIVNKAMIPSLFVNAADKDGNTAVIEAAKTGNTAIIKYLNAEKGAKVNTKNKKGNSALGYAIANRHQKAAELLIQLNAKTDVYFKEDGKIKQKLMVIAVKKGLTEVAAKILEKTDKKELLTTYSDIDNALLLEAVKTGDTWFVQQLLDYGMDINQFYSAPYYATPLLFAAYSDDGSHKMLDMMIKRPELKPETVKDFVYVAINTCSRPDLNTVQYVLKNFFVEHHIAEFNQVIYDDQSSGLTLANYAKKQVNNGKTQCKPLSDYLAYISDTK